MHNLNLEITLTAIANGWTVLIAGMTLLYGAVKASPKASKLLHLALGRFLFSSKKEKRVSQSKLVSGALRVIRLTSFLVFLTIGFCPVITSEITALVRLLSLQLVVITALFDMLQKQIENNFISKIRDSNYMDALDKQ